MGGKLAECAAAANPAGESPQEPLLKRLIEMGMDNMLRWTFMMAKGDPETVVKQGTHPLLITFADGAHNIVRVIDALLFGEAVAGKRIPPQAEDVLRHWLYVLLDNPTHLMAKFMPEAGQELVHAHDSREAVLALTALIRYRDDDRARQYARKFLERLLGLTHPDGTFNAEEIAKHPRLTGLWTRFSEQTKGSAGQEHSLRHPRPRDRCALQVLPRDARGPGTRAGRAICAPGATDVVYAGRENQPQRAGSYPFHHRYGATA